MSGVFCFGPRVCAGFNMPGEEGGGGKIDIIKAGYYKDVNISIMSHPPPLNGCFYPTLALYIYEAEFLGKTARSVIPLSFPPNFPYYQTARLSL